MGMMGIPNFAKWFGKSAVKDAAGEPLRVYHGTTAPDFESFIPKYNRKEQIGFGSSFTSDPKFASDYAIDPNVIRKTGDGRVIPAYLKMENPLQASQIVKEGTAEFELAEKLAGKKLFTQKDEDGAKIAYLKNAIDSTDPKRAEQIIKEYGYDGIVYEAEKFRRGLNYKTDISKAPTYTVFEPTQIKSPFNSGTFDPTDPNILKTVGAGLGLMGGATALSPEQAQAQEWSNYKNNEPSLQEPTFDPVSLLAPGGIMANAGGEGINALLKYLTNR